MTSIKIMKSRRTLFSTLFGGIIAVAGLAGGAMAQSNSSAEKEVTSAVQGIVAAYGQGPAGLEKYFANYADDMSVMYSRGRWTKAEYYKMWSELNANGGGVSSAHIEDLRVQVSPRGDVAVTTYQMPVVRRYPGGVVPAGDSTDVTYNMVDVWFKVNGKWMVKSLAFMRLVSTPRASPSH